MVLLAVVVIVLWTTGIPAVRTYGERNVPQTVADRVPLAQSQAQVQRYGKLYALPEQVIEDPSP